VLLDQVLDDQLLMAMDPTREGKEYTTCPRRAGGVHGPI
jgi:hypothetical protein